MAKWMIVALVLAASVPLAAAQMRGGFGGSHAGGFRNGGGFGGQPGNRLGRGLVVFGDPFSYADYPTTYVPPAAPVVIVPPPASAPAPAESKIEPLMIEWQGDHYVRFDDRRQAEKDAPTVDFIHRASPSGRPVAAPQTLPPAVLIFRDGHREEVSDYVITNGNLYARGNYWQDGFWTKTVPLSALDLPSTLRANSETGVKFPLPSGPNEVVTRP
ncbi:MAG TPA: hypothetical protein VFB28_11425 [Terriglobales bacterium]|nr:hypothetical protein [Terriglobales bacterium]